MTRIKEGIGRKKRTTKQFVNQFRSTHLSPRRIKRKQRRRKRDQPNFNNRMSFEERSIPNVPSPPNVGFTKQSTIDPSKET